MDLSPKAKLGFAYVLSILIPGFLTMIRIYRHQVVPVWMWAPAGVLTALFAIDYCITNRKKPLFKKIFFGSLIAADLYFMVHIDKGKIDDPKMVLAFSITSLFLFGSFIYSSFSIKSETERPRLNFFSKVGLGIFKVIAGTRNRYFWFMSSIYFAGVMTLTIPGHKPPWAWWVGGGTTLMYLIYNLAIMRRNERETEARFSRLPLQQEMPMSGSRPDPHPAGIDRLVTGQPAERNRTVTIHVEGRTIAEVELSQDQDPIVEMIMESESEPKPESRLARVLRDNYPL